MHKHLRILSSVVLLLVWSGSASGAWVIDDFEQGGPIDLFADHTTSPAPEHTATGINVPGGMRRVTLNVPSEPEKQITCQLPDTAGDDGIAFFGKNPPNHGFSGALIDYGKTSIGTSWPEAVDLELDLTPHGDRFYVDFEIDQDRPTGYRIQLFIQHSTVSFEGGSYWHQSRITFYPADGRQSLLFDDFTTSQYASGPELAFEPDDVQGIAFWIISSEVREAKPPLRIMEFGVVPEPASLGLLAIGGLALIRRPRSMA
jgi:hypothetical protein